MQLKRELKVSAENFGVRKPLYIHLDVNNLSAIARLTEPVSQNSWYGGSSKHNFLRDSAAVKFRVAKKFMSSFETSCMKEGGQRFEQIVFMDNKLDFY